MIAVKRKPCPVQWPECSPEGCGTCDGKGYVESAPFVTSGALRKSYRERLDEPLHGVTEAGNHYVGTTIYKNKYAADIARRDVLHAACIDRIVLELRMSRERIAGALDRMSSGARPCARAWSWMPGVLKAEEERRHDEAALARVNKERAKLDLRPLPPHMIGTARRLAEGLWAQDRAACVHAQDVSKDPHG